MPELRYIPNSNPWPMDAEYSGLILKFTGTFDVPRIQARRNKLLFSKFVDALLILLCLIASIVFVLQAYKSLPEGNITFFLQKGFSSFLIFIGIYSAMYLYARVQQRNIQKHTLNYIRLEQHLDTKQALDVYTLFSKEASQAWDSAGEEAQKSAASPDVLLLLKLCESDEAKAVFFRLDINREHFKSSLSALPQDNRSALEIPYIAFEEAMKLKSSSITAHILLYAAIKHSYDADTGALARMLREYGIDPEKIETVSAWETNIETMSEELSILHTFAKRKNLNTNKGLTAIPTPYLDHFSTDLTALAKRGALPMTLARNEDLENIFKIFSNNTRFVTLKGEEGTGKTSILNALAYKMVSEEVPRILEDKRLIKLETSAIVGSDSPPEAVISSAINEAERSGNIVLAIEDVHLLHQSQGAHGLNLLQVLISRLSESKLMAISTTTPSAFLDFASNTSNFEQLFSTYELLPLTEKGLIQAACLKASFLELDFKIFYTYASVESAVQLSNEFFKNQGQPQAVVSLLTSAAEKFKGSGKRRAITAEDIQEIVSEKSHVPKESLSENDSEKLLSLEDQISKHVIGQKAAVKAVSEAIRRSRSGLSGKNRPVGSFLFVGPTGVGKTELAKTLAKVYFGSEKFFLRLDMSEYQGNDGIKKLLGSTTNEKTVFVKHLEEYPFCLFLLDEFEKASREVLNLFLQVLEDGRLTTDTGKTLDLSKTIIIATSNAGTSQIQDGIRNGKSVDQIKATLFEEILSKNFAPELLNRFDDVILFSPLTPEEVSEVAKLFLQSLGKQIKETKDIDFVYSEEAARLIAEAAYDPLLGARPIRRYIQDHVDTLIANEILQTKPKAGARLKLQVSNGALLITQS